MTTGPPVWLDDVEFGRRFVRRVVTASRVDAALAELSATRLQLGPYASGPIGLARVAGQGRLGRSRISPRDDGSFAVTVPAVLDFAVRIGAETRVGADAEVDLVLIPRPADPMLIVIDIAPVRGSDVRIKLRGAGLAVAVTTVLNPLLVEMRTYLAGTINSLLDSSRLRAGRTIDIGARIDGSHRGPTPDRWHWIDYATFGARLMQRIVTRERVADGFAGLAGQAIEVGPLRAGPRDVADVRATGQLGTPRLRDSARPGIAFDASLPLTLDLVVALARQNRYRAEITIELAATARAAEPLVVVIDVAPVAAEAVDVSLVAEGAAARLLGRIGNLADQIRRQVVTVVNVRLADVETRTVDLGARIDAAADQSSRPNRPRPRPRR